MFLRLIGRFVTGQNPEFYQLYDIPLLQQQTITRKKVIIITKIIRGNEFQVTIC